ncbi:MAG: glycosyltransferase family 4 protein [Actinomycetes bacterium]
MNPAAWSGVPYGIVSELQRLGVLAGVRNAIPWPTATRALYRWMELTRRTERWTARPEMRTLTWLSNHVHAAATPHDVDAWVQFVGGYGRLARGRYVTVFELSPAQLIDAGPVASSLGYPGYTRSDLSAVARLHRHVYRGAYACCMASRWAADALVRETGVDARRVHVIGYGRNLDIAAPTTKDWSRPRYLFVGRSWQRKNGDRVLRAFARVRKDFPDAQLDLVGDHPDIEVDGVVAHGLVEVSSPEGRAHLERLFSAATCFVVPSLLEPFGIVYVEAAAAGVASIAGNIGGTADSVGDGGLLVDPYDDDDIYAAMRAFADPDAAKELARVAQARSTEFTWAKTGQRVLRALDLGLDDDLQLADFL